MNRATKGKSMDGEVLIIGRVVGWSGWVPKSLTCGEGSQGAWLCFTSFFGEGFFWRFLAIWCRFEGFWEAQMGIKIEF